MAVEAPSCEYLENAFVHVELLLRLAPYIEDRDRCGLAKTEDQFREVAILADDDPIFRNSEFQKAFIRPASMIQRRAEDVMSPKGKQASERNIDMNVKEEPQAARARATAT